eukprot:6602882-Pyramimonas_sp.AAC.1
MFITPQVFPESFPNRLGERMVRYLSQALAQLPAASAFPKQQVAAMIRRRRLRYVLPVTSVKKSHWQFSARLHAAAMPSLLGRMA